MLNGLVADLVGNKCWYLNDELHREDGPAVEWVNGDTWWYYKGIFVGEGDHPEPVLWERLTSVEFNGGPLLNGCVVDLDGIKIWFKDDQLHREDGPAVEYAGGVTGWYFKDIYAGSGDKPDPELWTRLTSHELNGGPMLNGCIVDLDGDKFWYKDNQFHREDGPAVVGVDGTTEWFFHGKQLGFDDSGFWELWDLLTEEQRGNPTLLKWMPR